MLFIEWIDKNVYLPDAIILHDNLFIRPWVWHFEVYISYTNLNDYIITVFTAKTKSQFSSKLIFKKIHSIWYNSGDHEILQQKKLQNIQMAQVVYVCLQRDKQLLWEHSILMFYSLFCFMDNWLCCAVHGKHVITLTVYKWLKKYYQIYLSERILTNTIGKKNVYWMYERLYEHSKTRSFFNMIIIWISFIHTVTGTHTINDFWCFWEIYWGNLTQ